MSPEQTGPPTDDEGWIDRAVLDELRGLADEDEPDLLVAVIDLFLSEGQANLEAMRAALARADAPALRLAAHTLKGSSASLGLARLRALCAEIEALAVRESLADGETPLRAAETEFARLGPRLRAECAA